MKSVRPSRHDRLTSQEAVDWHLRALLKIDPRLRAIRDFVGPFPPRSRPRGFPGLARVICGQQVSVASADAIWSRLEKIPRGTTAEGFLALGEESVPGVGLSRSKHRAIRALAAEIVSGRLDFDHLESLPAEAAIAALVQHPGIGPWTAEVYLMFCAGHPDVFPAGDIVLQKAVSEAFAIDPRLDRETLIALAAKWSPHRATAALLFWRFHAVKRGRVAVPV